MKKKEEAINPQSSKMKNGEYELHVLVEATSALSLESDSNIDVKISITAFGETENSKVKNSVGVEETFWGEHFYFSKSFDGNNSIEGQRVLFSVYDYNRITSNSLVGNYEVDIRRIYSEKDHCVQHVWLALSNMERSFNEIAGYIKVSLCVVGEGEKSMELSVEPISSITEEKKVLMPPNVERKTYQVIVDVFEGRNISPVDGTTVDSEIGVEFGRVFASSKTIMKNCNPKYKARVFVPLCLPAVIENIIVRINDFNFIQKGEVIGSHYININKLLQKDSVNTDVKQAHLASKDKKMKITDLQWVNFYGPQLDASNKEQKNIHQFFPELATYYVGSVLMKIKIKEESEPVAKYEEIPEETVKTVEKKREPPIYYEVSATISGAINLEDKNSKYKICVRTGGEEMYTDFSESKNGFCFWNVEKKYVITVEQNQVVPDIFVYLVNSKNKKICYIRVTPQDGVVLEDQWVKLKPDLAIVNLKSEEGGYLKIGLKMEKVMKKKQIVTNRLVNPLTKLFEKDRKSGRLVIELICAESLTPLDEDGSADPFFTFTYMHAQSRSSLKNDTLNPNYFEKIILEADILDDEACPPIIVNCFDQDKFTTDFIGSAFVDVGECLKNKSLVYGNEQETQPAWIPLTQNGIESGRFLASFRLLPNFTGRIAKQINLERELYSFSLVILGLRGLKSTSVISVKQPYIEFDFENLSIYNRKEKQEANETSQIIKTEPFEMGSSININQIIPTKLLLPKNYKYWPSLSARVKDNVLAGFYEPILGYFSINLQDAFVRSQKAKEGFLNRKEMIVNNKSKIKHKSPRLRGISDHVLLSLRNFVIKSINYNWKVLSPSIQGNLNKLSKNPKAKIDVDYVVVFPCYEKEQFGRESLKESQKGDKEPTKSVMVQKHKPIITKNGQYMAIGFDDKKNRYLPLDKRNKHYRFCLNETYESYYERVHGFKMGVMCELPIRKGRIFDKENTAASMVRKVSTEDTFTGMYKGNLFIQQYLEGAQMSEEEKNFKEEATKTLNKLVINNTVHMYLYIIEAANLPPKDQFSHSDSYIVVKTGSQTYDFENENIEDEPNPQYFKKIHIPLKFPKDSVVHIEIWDYDPVLADELIGTVTLDVENRIQADFSNNKPNNPIETHNIMNEKSKIPQGLLRFWVDLVPNESHSLYREFNIGQKSAEQYEVRVIVWNVRNMPNDDFEDMSDLYATCQFNNEVQETDVHYRSSTGDGCFNWRMIFPVKLPIKNNIMTFKVFDKDLLSGNDYLASAAFSIEEYLSEAFETDNSMALYLGLHDYSLFSDVPTGKCRIVNGQKRYDRFSVKLRNRADLKQKNTQEQGEIQISIQILNAQDSKKKHAGKGRSDPNQHPHLPEPKGRFEWSLNPMKIISQLCGPRFKAQICIAIYCIFFLVLCIYFGSSFGGGVIGAKIGS